MTPIPAKDQQSLVGRLIQACGGGYTPEIRRKFFITGPQWAAAYEGHALFHAPTRTPIDYETVIRKYAEIGVGHWCTHDTDVIPTDAIGTAKQDTIVAGIQQALARYGLQCSMVTTETFHHAVWAASPAAEAPQVRDYAAYRIRNTIGIGHELGAQFAVYWPGSLGYLVQGAIDEVKVLERYADGLNAACEEDLRIAKAKRRPTMKHCLEAKPFEPAAQILLPTSDAMLAFIYSGRLKHPEMVGLNPEYLHELMWGGAVRPSLAHALMCGKLWHFDINDGYRLKHDVDIAVGLVNPLDWLNVFVLLRSYGCNGPFNLHYEPPRTTSNWGGVRSKLPNRNKGCQRHRGGNARVTHIARVDRAPYLPGSGGTASRAGVFDDTLNPAPESCNYMGMGLGRTLIILGIVMVIAGVVITLAGRFTSLGRLPGDIVYKRNNFTLYFPVVTSLLLSLVLTAVMWLINRR